MRPRSSEVGDEQVPSMRAWRVGVGALLLVLLPGCEYLPAELRSPKLPFRVSALKHEVTVQSAQGMGPAPFTVDQATAGSAEMRLRISNAAASAIQVVWTEGSLITADSLTYPVGVKVGQDGLRAEPTTIEPNGAVQVTVVALTKEGKPVASGGTSVEPPYRVGLKLTVEWEGGRWKGTVWIFVS